MRYTFASRPNHPRPFWLMNCPQCHGTGGWNKTLDPQKDVDCWECDTTGYKVKEMPLLASRRFTLRLRTAA